MRILFQGDSITDGNRYRLPEQEWDKNHQIGHSYAYIISGLLGARYPEKDYAFYNKGISGNRIVDLLGRVHQDVTLVKPDLLSLLVGVNDLLSEDFIGRSTDPSLFRALYALFLEQVCETLPEVKLIVMEPFLLPGNHLADSVDYRENRLAPYQQAAKDVAADFSAVYVPLQDRFNALCAKRDPMYWLWDGVHPTEAGHAVVADAWLKAAAPMLGIEDELRLL